MPPCWLLPDGSIAELASAAAELVAAELVAAALALAELRGALLVSTAACGVAAALNISGNGAAVDVTILTGFLVIAVFGRRAKGFAAVGAFRSFFIDELAILSAFFMDLSGFEIFAFSGLAGCSGFTSSITIELSRLS